MRPSSEARPRLGEARRQRLARHRLHHRVVQRVEHHEGRDDALRLGRVEPGRRQRDVNAPRSAARRAAAAKATPGAPATSPSAVSARRSRRVMPVSFEPLFPDPRLLANTLTNPSFTRSPERSLAPNVDQPCADVSTILGEADHKQATSAPRWPRPRRVLGALDRDVLVRRGVGKPRDQAEARTRRPAGRRR